MRVDKKLIESVVEQILGQLSQTHGHENVLILRSRNDGTPIHLPPECDLPRKLYFSDEAYDASQIDRYILPKLEINDMVDLTLGKANSQKGNEVLDLLLAGKVVEVLEYSYTAFENTAPPRLFQLYCNYTEILEGLGLRSFKQVQKRSRLNKRVVSEKDIKKCQAEGVKHISLPDSAMVTSLAWECAKKFGIKIIQDERGA